MKTTHTPGPWEVDGFDVTSIIKNEGSDTWPQWRHVAVCNYGYAETSKYFESNKANAKLIAAAPDLLEAAKYAFECLSKLEINTGDLGDQASQSLEAAIKKATE